MKWLVLVLILAACGPAEYDDVANQTVGLNTTADPKALPKGAHPQFMRLEYTGGAIKPRKGNTTYATPTGTELWLFQQLNVSEVAELHYEGLDPWYAYVAKDGGTVTIRDAAGATTAATYAVPGGLAAATTRLVWEDAARTSDVLSFAAAWTGADEYRTGLSSVTTLDPNDLWVFFLASGSGPETIGTTVTSSAGGTFVLSGANFEVNTTPYLLGHTITGPWAAGNTATWAGGGSVTLAGAPCRLSDVRFLSFDRSTVVGFPPAVGDTVTSGSTTGTVVGRLNGTTAKLVYVTGVSGAYAVNGAATWTGGSGTIINEAHHGFISCWFAAPASAPAGAYGWSLHYLSADGSWLTVWAGGTTTAHTFTMSEVDSAVAYDGPLDANGLPETLTVLPSSQAVAMHKGSLFVAAGRDIYVSEPTQYRRFRDGYALSARDSVLKMVSVPINKGLDYILQVFTPTGMQFIIGESPNWEIRQSNITEGPVARYSIAPSDVGTWALYDDGLYLIASVDRVNVTRGVNDTWIRNMSTPSAAVGAADKGIYRLVDNAGKVLGYDWETKQFFEDTFSAKPDGFLYRDAARALVAKIGSTYTKVGTTAAAVAWTLELPTGFSGMQSQTPGYLYLDAAGDMTLTYYVDGELLATFTLDPSDEPDHLIPLLQDRGFTWRIVLSGSGQASDTVLRAWAFR